MSIHDSYEKAHTYRGKRGYFVRFEPIQILLLSLEL